MRCGLWPLRNLPSFLLGMGALLCGPGFEINVDGAVVRERPDHGWLLVGTVEGAFSA